MKVRFGAPSANMFRAGMMDSPLVRLGMISAGGLVCEPVRHYGEWSVGPYLASAYMPGGFEDKWLVRLTVQAQFDYSASSLSVFLNSVPLIRSVVSSNSFSPSANYAAEFSVVAFGGDLIGLSVSSTVSNNSSYLLTADLIN